MLDQIGGGCLPNVRKLFILGSGITSGNQNPPFFCHPPPPPQAAELSWCALEDLSCSSSKDASRRFGVGRMSINIDFLIGNPFMHRIRGVSASVRLPFGLWLLNRKNHSHVRMQVVMDAPKSLTLSLPWRAGFNGRGEHLI